VLRIEGVGSVDGTASDTPFGETAVGEFAKYGGGFCADAGAGSGGSVAVEAPFAGGAMLLNRSGVGPTAGLSSALGATAVRRLPIPGKATDP
jgi:hypothetical protein